MVIFKNSETDEETISPTAWGREELDNLPSYFEDGVLEYDINETAAETLSTNEILIQIRDAVSPDNEADVIYAASPVRAGQYADLSNMQVYKLSNGKYAVFDVNEELYISNGYLVNASGSTIVGYYVDNPEEVNVRDNQETIHIITPNSTNVLRYGSNMYVTTYYRNGQTYTSSTQYISATAERASKAFFNLSWWQIGIFALLFVLVVSIIFRNLSHKI